MSNPNHDHGGHDSRTNPEKRSKSMDNHKHDRNVPANDNGKASAPVPAGSAANDNGAIAPAVTGGALTSLAALGTVLNSVDTASVAGRSGLPMLRFSSGTWMFGQKKTVVEDGSRWAANPLTFKRGYICFGDGNKVIGERLVSISLPMPEITELPDLGFEWHQQWAVSLKCTNGADAGTDVNYKPTTVGGIQAVIGVIEAVRDRLNGGAHDGKVVPIVLLEKDSYQRAQYGRVWTPLLTIVDWMSLDGPPSARVPTENPTSAQPPADQPRRRRVA